MDLRMAELNRLHPQVERSLIWPSGRTSVWEGEGECTGGEREVWVVNSALVAEGIGP